MCVMAFTPTFYVPNSNPAEVNLAFFPSGVKVQVWDGELAEIVNHWIGCLAVFSLVL